MTAGPRANSRTIRNRGVPRSRAESFLCNYMYRMANRGSLYRQLGHFVFPFNGPSIDSDKLLGLLLPSLSFFMIGRVVSSRVWLRVRVMTSESIVYDIERKNNDSLAWFRKQILALFPPFFNRLLNLNWWSACIFFILLSFQWILENKLYFNNRLLIIFLSL